ncbi:hypothetical protein AMTR_s00080p00057770 [Amborella trichopoda]|uniref:Uncharacterized protein n=1 Tax=Amborella trichopoda TaxID=13333 RepID=W1PB24_AMBTC|nr:hypothetical protein AMTR_s00080p00057770 [Amborella trichopoda]
MSPTLFQVSPGLETSNQWETASLTSLTDVTMCQTILAGVARITRRRHVSEHNFEASRKAAGVIANGVRY